MKISLTDKQFKFSPCLCKSYNKSIESKKKKKTFGFLAAFFLKCFLQLELFSINSPFPSLRKECVKRTYSPSRTTSFDSTMKRSPKQSPSSKAAAYFDSCYFSFSPLVQRTERKRNCPLNPNHPSLKP